LALSSIISPVLLFSDIDLLAAEGSSYNKGRCFIEFESADDAVKAKKEMNEKGELKGKLLIVSIGISGVTKQKAEQKVGKYEDEQRELQLKKRKRKEAEEDNGEEGEQIDTSSKRQRKH